MAVQSEKAGENEGRTGIAASREEDPIVANGRKLGLTDNSIHVLRERYLKKGPDGKALETPEELFRRVSRVVAGAEKGYGATEEQIKELDQQFFELMVTGQFMPNSPTLMNAGREMGMLSACFVLPVGDSIDEIFNTVKATAMIQKAGGGTGFSFDRLRPTGDYIRSSGGTTSGPISFWRVLSETTNAIQQGAFRRGANMGMMSITHPDILKFIEAKQDLTQFTNYNISVKVPDDWMAAYRKNAQGPHVVINPRSKKKFVLPRGLDVWKYQVQDLVPLETYLELAGPKRPRVWSMGELYDLIVDHAWQTGEPGVVFIDRVNEHNATPQLGPIEATNPCGEQPLLPYEACNLGSINLGYYVVPGPDGQPVVNWEGLKRTVRLATRFLDDIIDVNNYPVPEITQLCMRNRKIGLGVMGFADALYKLGMPYNSEEGVKWGGRFMRFVNDESHQMSEELAKARGNFHNWPGSVWETLHHRPMRNACTTTVAPTGTISILAGCSSGVEPLFSLAFVRNVLGGQRLVEENPIFTEAARKAGIYSQELIQQLLKKGTLAHLAGVPEGLRRVFVCAHDISPDWHVRMQAAFQKHCDSSISKTTNFPEAATREDVRTIYNLAFDLGCKGITVYRDNCRKNQPMSLERKAEAPPDGLPSLVKPAKTPALSSALRIRQYTPFGHMHVNISVDPKSRRELEVFAQLGRAGDVAMSDLEAISRMVSLFLRVGGDMEHVMDQLEGIGATFCLTSHDGQLMSLADALGKTIRTYWAAKKQFGLEALLLGEADYTALQNGDGSGKPRNPRDSGIIVLPPSITGAQPARGGPPATPVIASSVRIRQKTPFGHMHVNITVDPKSGKELEVFAQLGRAGDVAMSDMEAIGRMVSLFLRQGGSIANVVDQLEGIGSNKSVPTKDGKVMSLGDALGKAVGKYLAAKEMFGLRAILLGDADLDRLPAYLSSDSGRFQASPEIREVRVGAPAGKHCPEEEALAQYKPRCPACGSSAINFAAACPTCMSCGYNKCG